MRVSVAAAEDVVPSTTETLIVVAIAATDVIVAWAALHRVVSRPTPGGLESILAIDDVVSGFTICIVPRGPTRACAQMRPSKRRLRMRSPPVRRFV